jgi:phosphonate transport system permease protein
MSQVDEKLGELARRRRIHQGAKLILGLVVLLVFWLGFFEYLHFDFEELTKQLPTWLDFLGAFTNPNFVDFSMWSINNEVSGWAGITGTVGYAVTHPEAGYDMLATTFGGQRQSTLLGLAATTVIIGVTGTILGFPFALIFGILGSERVVPFPFNFIFRGTMSIIRSVPALVWIFIYIPLVGINPVGAVLAIGTDTIGILGRLFTDELEEIDDGPIEAIRSTGGNRTQIVSFGMLSQVSTAFIAWTLYSLEINVRVAVSLGIVGAGGLGRYIAIKRSLFDFGVMAAGIMMIVIVVLTVELTSTRIRAWLRPSQHDSPGLLDLLRGLGDPGKWTGMRPTPDVGTADGDSDEEDAIDPDESVDQVMDDASTDDTDDESRS